MNKHCINLCSLWLIIRPAPHIYHNRLINIRRLRDPRATTRRKKCRALKKCCDAIDSGADSITIWRTWKATREFLCVEDATPSIVLATESYNKSEPVNIGAGFEISIKELVKLIVKFTGFEGEIVWDATKPDGQPRRMLDVRRAERAVGFRAKIKFEEGLKSLGLGCLGKMCN